MAKEKIVAPDLDAWKRLTRAEQRAYLARNGLEFRNWRFYRAKKK